MSLEKEIERLLNLPPEQAREEGLSAVHDLRDGLNRGDFRAAENSGGGWKTNVWVKRGIRLAFKFGVVVDRSVSGEFLFFDKDTLPDKPLNSSSDGRALLSDRQ